MCLACVFAPLKIGMTSPDVVHCPDGYFCRAIYSLGPYIVDYLGQVWLAGIVQGWCPKYVHYSDKTGLVLILFRCKAKPKNLDGNFKNERHHRHERTDFIMRQFDLGVVWDTYGIRSDIVVCQPSIVYFLY
jgi:hypothetical protein